MYTGDMQEQKMEENEFIKFWLQDGILYSVFKKPTRVDFKMTKEIIDLRHKISDNEKQYWCFDITNFNFLSAEAMNYAEAYGQEYLHATAVIIRSHVAQFIFNTFSRFKKVMIPFQAFKDKNEAVEWLKMHKKQTKR